MCVICSWECWGINHTYDIIDYDGNFYSDWVCDECNTKKGYNADSPNDYMIIRVHDIEDEGYTKYLFVSKKKALVTLKELSE